MHLFFEHRSAVLIRNLFFQRQITRSNLCLDCDTKQKVKPIQMRVSKTSCVIRKGVLAVSFIAPPRDQTAKHPFCKRHILAESIQQWRGQIEIRFYCFGPNLANQTIYHLQFTIYIQCILFINSSIINQYFCTVRCSIPSPTWRSPSYYNSAASILEGFLKINSYY